MSPSLQSSSKYMQRAAQASQLRAPCAGAPPAEQKWLGAAAVSPPLPPIDQQVSDALHPQLVGQLPSILSALAFQPGQRCGSGGWAGGMGVVWWIAHCSLPLWSIHHPHPPPRTHPPAVMYSPTVSCRAQAMPRHSMMWALSSRTSYSFCPCSTGSSSSVQCGWRGCW